LIHGRVEKGRVQKRERQRENKQAGRKNKKNTKCRIEKFFRGKVSLASVYF
jgi:hypothetical protein